MPDPQQSASAAASAAEIAGTPVPADSVVGTRRAQRTASQRRSTFLRRPGRAPGTPSRAGRNLPAAIAVSVGLLAPLLAGLLFFPLAFAAIVAFLAAVGAWEVCRALELRQIHAPLPPVLAGAVAMPFAAYLGGAEGLGFTLVFSVFAVVLWRTMDPAPGAHTSMMAGTFALLWVPFMLSFAMMLLDAETGPLMIATMLLLVIANDTFGYIVGVLFGKHAMAPKISPKKSWEGFAGSIAGATVVGLLAAVFLLDMPAWTGLVLAVAVVAAATAGDLAESMIKRELGVKDMGTILPGHGGIMDRLDSIVFASPMAFLLSATLVPGML